MSELEKTVSFFFVLAAAVILMALWVFGVVDPVAWIQHLGDRPPVSCNERPSAYRCIPS